MVITYKNLHKLVFPVFLLDSGNWDTSDGLLFIDGEVLDDKNQKRKTLGARRVQTPIRNCTY